MNLKNSLITLVVILSLFMPQLAKADNLTLPPAPLPESGEIDVGPAISPMKKGQVAPFTGILLSPKAAATIIAQLNSMQMQINIEVDKARGEERAKCDYNINEEKAWCAADRKILQARINDQDRQMAIVNEALKESEKSRPNTTLWVGLGTGLGFVGGVAMTVLTVWAVNQSSK
jgi:hypothetical protein